MRAIVVNELKLTIMKEISKMMLPALQEAMASVIFGQNTAKSKWHGWKEPQSEKHKCLLLTERKKNGFTVRKQLYSPPVV